MSLSVNAITNMEDRFNKKKIKRRRKNKKKPVKRGEGGKTGFSKSFDILLMRQKTIAKERTFYLQMTNLQWFLARYVYALHLSMNGKKCHENHLTAVMINTDPGEQNKPSHCSRGKENDPLQTCPLIH